MVRRDILQYIPFISSNETLKLPPPYLHREFDPLRSSIILTRYRNHLLVCIVSRWVWRLGAHICGCHTWKPHWNHLGTSSPLEEGVLAGKGHWNMYLTWLFQPVSFVLRLRRLSHLNVLLPKLLHHETAPILCRKKFAQLGQLKPPFGSSGALGTCLLEVFWLC